MAAPLRTSRHFSLGRFLGAGGWAVACLLILFRQTGGGGAGRTAAGRPTRRSDPASAQAATPAGVQGGQAPSAERSGGPIDPPAADEPLEDALSLWLERVRRLQASLARHPEWRIPQMALLDPTDWLEVTRDAPLRSEADVREALGRLRGSARRKAAARLAHALQQAVAAGDGQVPADPFALAPFLPPDLDPEMLRQLAINPSGQVPGLRSLDGPTRFFLVDRPVDDLWDGTLFYGPDGTWGARSASAAGQEAVARAIVRFTADTGASPTQGAELAGYPEIAGLEPARRDALFAALTTPAQF